MQYIVAKHSSIATMFFVCALVLTFLKKKIIIAVSYVYFFGALTFFSELKNKFPPDDAIRAVMRKLGLSKNNPEQVLLS